MKIQRLIIICVWFCMAVLPGMAGYVVFRHLTMSEELSHYSVMSLYQDERGLIWIGTRNGVNVYDGNSVEVYRHVLNDSNSIQNSYIRKITGDRKGTIFFQTIRGVSAFDIRREVFTTLFEGNVGDIYCCGQTLYLASGPRIWKYNREKKTFESYYELPDVTVNISSIHLNGQKLMIGTENKGLFVHELQERTTSHPIEQGRVSDIFMDSKGRYWVGTWKDGLYVMTDNGMKNYRSQPDKSNSLCADFVRTFCEDKQGDIWIGTFRGLNRYVEETDDFVALRAGMKTQLTHSSVWSLMCDVQGTLWVGTYFGGVNYSNASQTVYKHYISDENSVGSSVVGTMVEDRNRQLWVCTEGNGLCRLNPKTGETKWYKHQGTVNNISQNNLKSIYYDKEKELLWIGTHMGGLNRFDLRTERFTHYACSLSDKANVVCDILPYEGDLLLATHDGVYRFKISDGTFIPMLKESEEYIIDFALDLHLDDAGKLWIAGAEKGMYAYDFHTGKLVSYVHQPDNLHSLSSNGVNCLYEDSRKRLWVCSAEAGIDLYRVGTDDFENFSEESHGLLSNCVYGAYEIDDSRLLFITDNGFSFFDYSRGEFRNFKAGTSLPLTGINQKSVYRGSDGKVYIGGIDGLISFYPEDLDEMTSAFRIFPSGLFVNDREIEVGDDTGILQQALSETSKITLEHNQNMFSVNYSVTNYIPLIREDLAYKLENFSDTWSTLRNGRMVTYTNLNPGKYTLIVKNNAVSGADVPESRLEIEVLPPWYRSHWAYLCYLVVVLVVLYVIVVFYKRRLELQTELAFERKHIQDIESLNQYKLRFFTNISHEFRTPLTLIIGQLELLLQVKSFVPAVYNRILNAYKSSLQLQSLITELLDFRKQEQGHMKIKVYAYDMVGFLQENYLLFHEYARIHEIDFHFQAPEEPIEVWYDAKQMQKVINNLLSNAFQYTPKGGEITLSISKTDREVIVSVADTGKGIKACETAFIFDRFYQTEASLLSQGKGVGIGLALTKGIIELHHGRIEVESQEGKGSTFTFRLPLGKEHFKPEEMVEDDKIQDLIVGSDEGQRLDIHLMEEEKIIIPEQQAGKGTFQILIVEDDAGLRNMLADIFNPYYKVTVASNGKEALEKVEEEQPDIVLSDVLMPVMSGVELCKRLKNQLDTCHIPVVLLTARTAVEHRLEGLQYGADDYIVKPFDVNILLARCRNIVNSRLVLQEKFSKQPQATAQIFATNPLDKEFMDKAMGVVETNLDNPDFNVNLFAQEMAIARTKLFVKLKAITGQTPNDFILSIRIKKAACLLKNHPELNITEVSDRTGFNSPRYFSRVFKERYNQTPQAYRKGGEDEMTSPEE